MKSIMEYETVSLDNDKNALVIIDQTKLPNEIVFKKLGSAKEMWEAIYRLEVRGAPALGVAAAFGIYVLALGIEAASFEDFFAQFRQYKDYLNSARPTAVNLSWALARMEKVRPPPASPLYCSRRDIGQGCTHPLIS